MWFDSISDQGSLQAITAAQICYDPAKFYYQQYVEGAADSNEEDGDVLGPQNLMTEDLITE